jgi:cytochrome P450
MPSPAAEPPVRAPDGAWILSRHADVRLVLRSPNVGVDLSLGDGVRRLARRSGQDLSGLIRGHRALPTMRDGAEHAASRRAFARHAEGLLAAEDGGFGPRLDHALDALPTGVPIEAMQRLIQPLADDHLAASLGIGLADIHRQRNRFIALFEGPAPMRPLAELVALSALADGLFADTARLLQGRGLADPDTANLGALLFAVNLAGDGLRGLMAQVLARLAVEPAHQQRLSDDPARAEAFVRECLRISAVVPQVTRRIVSGEIVLPDAVLRAGDRLRLDLDRANRDPAVFAEPDRFLPGRSALPHLAFGAGPHTCQGARAGKALAETFAARLAARFRISAGFDRLTFLPGRITRLPESLTVTLWPRSPD